MVDADVVAVVPTLGRDVERLRRCLDSLVPARDEADLAIVVVWNDPRLSVPDLGDVVVLEPGCNLGFPGAILHARRRSKARYLWIVQDDMEIAAGCLATLVGRLDAEPDVAIVAPAIVDGDGLIPLQSRGGVLDDDHTMDHWFPVDSVRPEDFDTGVRLDWVASSGSLVRVSALDEIGGTDPSFFPLLWTDVDLGHRLVLAGHRVVVEPEARTRHDRNGSTPSLLGRFLASVNSERFRAKAAGETRPIAVDVDRDIVDLVLTSATNGFLDLARYAQGIESDRLWEAGQLRIEIDALRAELESSRAAHEALVAENAILRAELDAAVAEQGRLRSTRSMRITAPLRGAARLARIARDRWGA